MNGRTCSDLRTITDLTVICNANLATQLTGRSDAAAASHTNLCRRNGRWTNRAIVTNVDQIIELDGVSQASLTQECSVYSGVCTNLDIVPDDQTANLWHL